MSLKYLARMLTSHVAAAAGVEEDHEGEDHSDHEGEEHSDHEGEEHSDHEGEDHEDHDEHGDEHSDGIDIKTLKIIMLFAMFLCVGFGFIPKLWSKCRNNDDLLSNLNCFSAGIFLAMALIHMMPESEEIYRSWASEE